MLESQDLEFEMKGEVAKPKLHRSLNNLEAQQLREVRKRFKTKISPYLGALMKGSASIAKQFVPDAQEAIPFGTETPFEEGKDNRGIYGLERVYSDRAVLTPYFECAAYCRYCFKKTRTLGGEAKRMTNENLEKALAYIASDSRLKTILITGGDPLLDIQGVQTILERLMDIPHIRYIRVGTRNILFEPYKVTDELAEMLASYNRPNPNDLNKSKILTLGVSLNHRDELSPEVVRATLKLSKRGVSVRGQTVLMKGINDNPQDLQALMEGFVAAGITPYYLFHCMPVVGTKHLRTTVQKGVDILREISVFSGTFAPNYVYVTPLGKHRVGPQHPFEYVELEGQRYIRSKTPYKAKDFLEFSDNDQLPPLHTESEDGYVISHYLDGET